MLTVCLTVSYGAFIVVKNQTETNMITSACFSSSFTDSNSISLTGVNALPMTDSEGFATTPYHFTLTNSCTLTSSYYIILSVKNNSFSDTFINYSVNSTTVAKTLGYSVQNTSFTYDTTNYSRSYVIGYGTLAANNTATYDIRLWINNIATYTAGMTWEAEIKVVSVVSASDTYQEEDTNVTFKLIDSNGNVSALNTTPTSATHEFVNAVCTSNATADWVNDQLVVTGINDKTTCVAYFRLKS